IYFFTEGLFDSERRKMLLKSENLFSCSEVRILSDEQTKKLSRSVRAERPGRAAHYVRREKDRGIVFRRNVSVATYFPRLGININAIKWKIKARCRFTIHLLHSRISGTRRRERKGSRKPNRKPPPRGRR